MAVVSFRRQCVEKFRETQTEWVPMPQRSGKVAVEAEVEAVRV